jgi:hypothetical protein
MDPARLLALLRLVSQPNSKANLRNAALQDEPPDAAGASAASSSTYAPARLSSGAGAGAGGIGGSSPPPLARLPLQQAAVELQAAIGLSKSDALACAECLASGSPPAVDAAARAVLVAALSDGSVEQRLASIRRSLAAPGCASDGVEGAWSWDEVALATAAAARAARALLFLSTGEKGDEQGAHFAALLLDAAGAAWRQADHGEGGEGLDPEQLPAFLAAAAVHLLRGPPLASPQQPPAASPAPPAREGTASFLRHARNAATARLQVAAQDAGVKARSCALRRAAQQRTPPLRCAASGGRRSCSLAA